MNRKSEITLKLNRKIITTNNVFSHSRINITKLKHIFGRSYSTNLIVLLHNLKLIIFTNILNRIYLFVTVTADSGIPIVNRYKVPAFASFL